jgi:hypothetical protein
VNRLPMQTHFVPIARGCVLARCLVLAVLFSLPACHSVSRLGPLTPNTGLASRPPQLQVRLKNGSVETLHSPAVAGDSLVGYKRVRGAADSIRAAIALSDISYVEEREFSGTRTVGAVAAFALGSAIVLFITASIAVSNSMSHKS